MPRYRIVMSNQKEFYFEGTLAEAVAPYENTPHVMTIIPIIEDKKENCGSCLMYLKGKCMRTLEIVHSSDHCQQWETKPND